MLVVRMGVGGVGAVGCEGLPSLLVAVGWSIMPTLVTAYWLLGWLSVGWLEMSWARTGAVMSSRERMEYFMGPP